MKNRNKESTRYYSSKQEESVAKALGGIVNANSGAIKFGAGDVILEDFLLECKTTLTNRDSFSIKKEWIEKNRKEAFSIRKPFSSVVFNFGPGQENFYIISENLMKVLVEKLKEEK